MKEFEEPMKRILIVNNNMHIGGVQKALVNLLYEIHNDYEITLLLFYAGGELLSKIPEDVKVMAANAPFRCWGMTRHDASALRDKAARGFWAAAVRVLGREAFFPCLIRFKKVWRKRNMTRQYPTCTAGRSICFTADAMSLFCAV